MDFTAAALFILSSFLFAMFFAFILRFLVFRYISVLGLNAVPYFAWVAIVLVIIIVLEYAGVPISQYYAAFFKWLATQLNKNPFVIVMEAIG